MLAELAHGEHAGYDLTDTYARDGVRAWHMTLPQIYTALRELARDGLASTRTVRTSTRPPKTIYAITDDGRRALQAWMRTTPLQPSLKDELVLRAQLAEASDLPALSGALAERRDLARRRVETLDRERALATQIGAPVRAASVAHLIGLERLREAWASEVLTLVATDATRTARGARPKSAARGKASHTIAPQQRKSRGKATRTSSRDGAG
jgi:DNA-binding PadR family transcriptional regulator